MITRQTRLDRAMHFWQLGQAADDPDDAIQALLLAKGDAIELGAESLTADIEAAIGDRKAKQKQHVRRF